MGSKQCTHIEKALDTDLERVASDRSLKSEAEAVFTISVKILDGEDHVIAVDVLTSTSLVHATVCKGCDIWGDVNFGGELVINNAL